MVLAWMWGSRASKAYGSGGNACGIGSLLFFFFECRGGAPCSPVAARVARGGGRRAWEPRGGEGAEGGGPRLGSRRHARAHRAGPGVGAPGRGCAAAPLVDG